MSIYASIEETLNDTFNTGTNNEFIPKENPQVKNISPKNAIGIRKLFCSFINLLCNTIDEYFNLIIWINMTSSSLY